MPLGLSRFPMNGNAQISVIGFSSLYWLYTLLENSSNATNLLEFLHKRFVAFSHQNVISRPPSTYNGLTIP